MPSMLLYIGIYLVTMVAIALIIGHELRHKDDEDQRVFEEAYREHREAAQQQRDDFPIAANKIAASRFEPEVGSTEWLEDLFMRKPEKVR